MHTELAVLPGLSRWLALEQRLGPIARLGWAPWLLAQAAPPLQPS